MKIKALWHKWKKISTKIAVFQSKVLLTVLYFVLLGPFAFILRFTSDHLRLKNTPSSTWWQSREGESISPETLKNQF